MEGIFCVFCMGVLTECREGISHDLVSVQFLFFSCFPLHIAKVCNNCTLTVNNAYIIPFPFALLYKALNE